MVATLGIDTSSSSPASDFWIIEIGSTELTKAGSGNSPSWLPSRDIFFYASPRDRASLGGVPPSRGAWMEHLMAFDPASGKSTAITSGVTNNVQPSV
jgi:hypothetical protein